MTRRLPPFLFSSLPQAPHYSQDPGHRGTSEAWLNSGVENKKMKGDYTLLQNCEPSLISTLWASAERWREEKAQPMVSSCIYPLEMEKTLDGMYLRCLIDADRRYCAVPDISSGILYLNCVRDWNVYHSAYFFFLISTVSYLNCCQVGAGLKALLFIQITKSFVARERENQLTLIIRSQQGKACRR